MARARELRREDHPALWNVVEEMSIAAALPRMPRVYLVEDPAPNAFATGRNPEHAAVAVTTGLLRLMDRDELQGVVAHEIGHLKNRDVALIVTAGVMVAILMLILAPIFAQLMYFALSRRREFLADASGARFTRYPEGLARALEKLGGSRLPQQDQSRVTAPMYIVPPVHAGAMAARGGGGSLFSTHPPLAQRVRVLRAMGGGAGVADYLRAYQQVTGGRLLRTKPEDAGLGTRPAAPAISPAPPPLPAAPSSASDTPAARSRAASNALLTAGGWMILPCRACGAAIKLPPALRGKVQQCPRCAARLGIGQR
jgi:heat shock protein HtpX